MREQLTELFGNSDERTFSFRMSMGGETKNVNSKESTGQDKKETGQPTEVFGTNSDKIIDENQRITSSKESESFYDIEKECWRDVNFIEKNSNTTSFRMSLTRGETIVNPSSHQCSKTGNNEQNPR